MENLIRMDDLGVPLFLETPKLFLQTSSKQNMLPRLQQLQHWLVGEMAMTARLNEVHQDIGSFTLFLP